ncbi:MAG: phenylacetate-CoA oxygenase subunit PaaI [Bacteroidetes bacterium]|uniref:Phenylacetate-CoA oxygenase subunit PaaC n=1 Tax=Phaeocystidibacter marisrubri TaxID=1577780 RepID=A0A6L3ZFJ4_9FLAO|nr:1,2-phenylacetyl-CoA epoxidase subunit PaaC [Phaeocystidibacter marisrubri]KAB2816416.1 phenylacetate-CoA oxygenase subunit PaaC [Phaeocystidibacter marisrubri]TNE29563.1 MAG: phenylacetate-CoA oxygenase subunit PaaI [Bacteroidota bacterium]GGH68951.1 phenylacetic acid degradation protein [Phaeocystidibacter marisrubri]
MNNSDLYEYTLRLGDTALILGQRLSEWCGHGPVLEQDIALTNIALDQIGQARQFLQYAAELKGGDTTEDSLAYHRDAHQFRNLLLVEQDNGHWGDTLARQFFFDTYNYFLFERLMKSSDERISSIAQKAMKEITYHAQWSAEWIIRLGDGTEESHDKIQKSINDIWMWTGEMLEADELDLRMHEAGIGVDLTEVTALWNDKVDEILKLATLEKPESAQHQRGGKRGVHSEKLGYVLAEMQHIPKSYPNSKW